MMRKKFGSSNTADIATKTTCHLQTAHQDFSNLSQLIKNIIVCTWAICVNIVSWHGIGGRLANRTKTVIYLPKTVIFGSTCYLH
jgi:hypothetical protein